MIHFSKGSHAYRLMEMLSVTGEFPVCSLFLLGKERVVKDVVHRLRSEQDLRDDRTGEMLTCRMLRLSGKGYQKSVRIYKPALPVLDWLHPGAYSYYMDSFWGHKFPGDMAHRERNHRVAESAAMCMGAGIEVRPYVLPMLQCRKITFTVPSFPSLYYSRDIKVADGEGMNKTMFTRMTGAVFSPGGCYAVYNTRKSVMKWNGMGEFKAMHSLSEICRMNAGVEMVDSAILFGGSGETAVKTLLESDNGKTPEFRFDSIYPHVHFIPMSQEGMEQMKILISPDWKERLMDLLFETGQTAAGGGMFEHDAVVDGVYVLSHLDGDIARLIRFREGAVLRTGRKEVLCFPHQLEYLQGYLGDVAGCRVLELEAVMEGMGLDGAIG